MFRWLNKQGVESSQGFTLQSMHRFYYHYVEGDHIMNVIVEPLGESLNDYHEEIVLRSIEKWQPPYDSETLSVEKIEQIKKNISAALDFMHIKHTFS